MATLAENLVTRRDAIGVELAAMGPTKVGGLADAIGNPLRIAHVAYKDALYRELKEINDQLGKIGGPVQVDSYGIV